MPTRVSTGQITITDVNDALQARLSNEFHGVPADFDGSSPDLSGCVTTLSVFQGTQDLSVGWTVTATPSAGVTGSLVGKTYTVTGLTADTGFVDLAASKLGFPSLTARFSVAKVKKGNAGPAITLVASAQGFTFKDNVATPAAQSITFTLTRQNAFGPATFYATDGAVLTGTGDSRTLDLASFGENRQVTVTVAVGELTDAVTVMRLDSSTAEAGATRNVHRGPWANATAYAIGDTVIHGGYGWSCVLAHTSATGTNTPPAYPTASNTWWTLAAVKGDDAKMAMLTASSFVFKVAQDGTVSPSSIALTAVGQNLAGSPTFTVTSGTAVLTGTGEARVLNAASLTSDQATIKVTWDGREDYVTITKVREGAGALSVVMGNEAHALPASSAGAVSSYTGSGTTIGVFEGGTALSASSSATVSAFRIGTITVSPSGKLTPGAVSYAGSKATIAAHSAMDSATDTVTLSIPVTIYRADGSSVTVTKVQTLTKSKQGATGATGATGTAGLNFSDAKLLTADPTFQNGSNLRVYNNAGGGTVTLTREAKQVDSPFTDSAFNVKVSNTGAASPGQGGFYQNINTRASAVFVQRIVAKIPVGYTIEQATNAMGDGATNTWITSKAGTGKFEEYILVRRCGATGTFSGSGHIYIVGGGAGTPEAPLNWYLAYAATYDFTALGFGSITAILSNETHTVPTDKDGNNGNFSGAVTTLSVFNGTTDDSANWTVAATPSGVTGSLAGKTYTVTALSGDTGYVDLTASRSGYASVTRRFSLSKAKTGATGSSAVVGILSNEAHTVPTDSAGNNGVFSGATTTLTIYNGLVDDSANWTYSVTKSNVTCSEAATSRTQTVTAMSADTGYVEITASRSGYANVVRRFSLSKAKQGLAGAQPVSVVLSNEAHVFPADSSGAVGSYAGSGTEIRVYEGTTPLVYDGVGTANGTWKVTTSPLNLTVGSLTDSGDYLTVGDHSGMSSVADRASVTYTIVGKTAGGASFSIPKQQSFGKSKAGAQGVQGPALSVTPSRTLVFTATDGVLDGSQADIVLTAAVSGIGSPAYVWTFSGFQTAPTSSGTSSQTITAAQFGTAKAATVTCTVNGSYVDTLTIVRLEKSTAAAGATVGGTLGENIGGKITPENASALIATAAIGGAFIADAAITEAKIQNAAIGTLKIGNNAVTVPLFSQSFQQVTLTANYQDVMTSASVTYPHQINVAVTMTTAGYGVAGNFMWTSYAEVYYKEANDQSWTLLMTRANMQLYSNYEGSGSITQAVVLPAGTYQFKVALKRHVYSADIYNTYVSIQVTGALR